MGPKSHSQSLERKSSSFTQRSKERKSNELSSKQFRIAGAIALLALATGCATNSTTQTTDLLTAAGFKLVTTDTPKKQELLKSQPADQLSLVTWKSKAFYVQPDVANNQTYVGTPAEYQTYQQLRLAKQSSNDNLMAAQMDQDAMDRWGAWGPGLYGGFYGRRF